MKENPHEVLETSWNAVLLAAVGGAAPPVCSIASAQNVDCETLPQPIDYGVGGSAQRPLFSKLGAKLAASKESLTVVYASPGACFAMESGFACRGCLSDLRRDDGHWLALALLIIVGLQSKLVAQEHDTVGRADGVGEPASQIHEEVSDRDAKKPLSPLRLGMFVDAYAAWQSSGTGTLATLSEHRAFTGQGASLLAENGLSLAFLGFDAEYDAGSFGVVANLRFGPAARIFHGDSDLAFGIDLLTQAYALYRPVPALQLDAGMFISPFGYEALESWKNPNYTISALYTYGQPNWHVGLRAMWQVDPQLRFTGMVVNGINNISETQQFGGLDQKPQLGGTISYEASSVLSFALSGLLAIDQTSNDDEGYDAFADFVMTLDLDGFITALNVDYIFTRDGAPSGDDRHFIGFMLITGYRISDMFGIAARGEHLRDDASFDGRDIWHLWTGTLTLDVKPIPNKQYLIVRWENRWEHSNQRIFGSDSRRTQDTADDSYRHNWFESVLGVVVTTSP